MRWIQTVESGSGSAIHLGVDAESMVWTSIEGGQPQCLGRVAEVAQARREADQVRIELKDGRSLLSADFETLAAWFPGLQAPRKVRSPLTIVLVLFAALLLFVYAVIRFAVPVLGDWAASWIPASFEQELQEPVRQSLGAQGFGPSTLPAARQAHYRERFNALVADLPNPGRFVLEFRSFEAPNAFALPGGVIVFTDPIFPLFADDAEFLAVAAHEIGHVHERHIMRSLLRSSTLTLLSAVLFGDVGSAGALADSVPALMLNSAYSRDFEREADQFAFNTLKRHGLPPQALGRFLKKLSEHSGGDLPGVLRYAASHPATEERIEAAEAAGREP